MPQARRISVGSGSVIALPARALRFVFAPAAIILASAVAAPADDKPALRAMIELCSAAPSTLEMVRASLIDAGCTEPGRGIAMREAMVGESYYSDALIDLDAAVALNPETRQEETTQFRMPREKYGNFFGNMTSDAVIYISPSALQEG